MKLGADFLDGRLVYPNCQGAAPDVPLEPQISPFRVTAVLLWLFTAFAEAGAHGLILANRLGDVSPRPRGFWIGALLIALAVGLWSHSKVAAALYIALTSAGALAMIAYAFLDAGIMIGLANTPTAALVCLPSVLMIQRWSDLNNRK